MTRAVLRAALAPFVALALLLAAPMADAQPVPQHGTEPDARLLGRRITSITIEGAPGVERLLAQVPLRVGQPLVRSRLQQGVRALYRSDRFSRVSVWAEEVGPREVRVRYIVEPRRRVSRLVIAGLVAGVEESALRRAADLPPGTEFSPARVQRAAQNVAQALLVAGWRDARVRWNAEPDGEDLIVRLDLEPGRATTLVRLEFEGDRGLADPELFAAFDLRPGDRLVVQRITEGVAELRERFRSRAFYRAQVGTPRIDAADGRAVVVVPVAAGPRFQLQVRGAHAFEESALLDHLAYRGESPLDRGTQNELAARLQAFYELAGFPSATVQVRENTLPPGPRTQRTAELHLPSLDGPTDVEPPRTKPLPPQRIVTFIVKEGAPLRVVERSFTGLTAFNARELEQRIDLHLEDAMPDVLRDGRDEALLRAARVGGSPNAKSPRRVVAREVFAKAPYAEACSYIADVYRSQGFLDARVGPARLEPLENGTARVVVPIVEGPRTLVSAVRTEGVMQMPQARVDALVTVRQGDPLSFFAVEDSRASIAALYQSAGHLYAEVEEDTEIDDATSTATVVFRVREGPVVRVSRIELKGLEHTEPSLVLGSLTLREGDPITPLARQESTRNLLRLGLFLSVSVEPADPQVTEAEKPLVVTVREKPSLALELRAGFSVADGPRTAGQFTWGNLFGRNQTFTANAKVNWPFLRLAECLTCDPIADPIERRLNLSYALPWYRRAGETPLEVRIDGVHENLIRPAFQLTRYAGLVSADGLGRTRVGPFEVTTILQAELEKAQFTERSTEQVQAYQSLADRQAQLLPQGDIVLASLRPAVSFDARDDRLNPMSGTFVSIAMDFSKSLFAEGPAPERTPFDTALIRTLVTANGYVPLYRPKRVVLALSGRFGGILKAEGSEVIGTKRFFLGGTQTMRGFNEDGLIPEDVRRGLKESLHRCDALASGLGCTDEVRQLARGVYPQSQGGELLVAAKGELRFGLTDTFDGGVFVDAGNLWLDPSEVDLTQLRYSAGIGLRMALPIGPAALDLGFNLDRDSALGEPPVRLHLAIGLF